MEMGSEYFNLDIGELYSSIHEAKSLEELREIKQEAVRQGHFGVYETATHEENLRALKQAGADEIDIQDFEYAFVNSNHDTLNEIMLDNNLRYNYGKASDLEQLMTNTGFNSDCVNSENDKEPAPVRVASYYDALNYYLLNVAGIDNSSVYGGSVIA
jgi:hypothetical protein